MESELQNLQERLTLISLSLSENQKENRNLLSQKEKVEYNIKLTLRQIDIENRLKKIL